MENKLKYLVVDDYNRPNAELICNTNGDPQIRVIKFPKSSLRELSPSAVCAMLKSCLLVFEPVESGLTDKRKLAQAVAWYQDWLGEEMLILDKKR